MFLILFQNTWLVCEFVYFTPAKHSYNLGWIIIFPHKKDIVEYQVASYWSSWNEY